MYDYDDTQVINGNTFVLTLDYPIVKDSGGGGTNDYNELINKPSINGVELVGNKTSKDLNIDQEQGLSDADIDEIIQDADEPGRLTNEDIDEILNSI